MEENSKKKHIADMIMIREFSAFYHFQKPVYKKRIE